MRAIFISYRREDAEGQAGRLFHDLVQHFGKQAVFMDVVGIEPGRDFRQAIDEQVASCGVLLAVMGKSWIDAKYPDGRRRLEDPQDFVRLETSSALKRDIPVVPVLVQGAHMPIASQLPPELTDLAFRNAIELTHARWDSDLALLIEALERHVKPAVSWRVERKWLLRLGVPLVSAAVLAAVLALRPQGSGAGDSSVATEPAKVALPLQPVESKPVEPNPVESKPGESKPVEPKPVESKPVESKPVEPKPVEPKPGETTVEPVTHHPQTGSARLAPQLVGRWTWGQPCSKGPNVRLAKGQLVFTTPDTRFVHRIESDDGTTLRTRVIAPLDHAGDEYELRLSGSELVLVEPKKGETNRWTRCGAARGSDEAANP